MNRHLSWGIIREVLEIELHANTNTGVEFFLSRPLIQNLKEQKKNISSGNKTSSWSYFALCLATISICCCSLPSWCPPRTSFLLFQKWLHSPLSSLGCDWPIPVAWLIFYPNIDHPLHIASYFSPVDGGSVYLCNTGMQQKYCLIHQPRLLISNYKSFSIITTT